MKEIRLLRADEVECRIAQVNAWGISILLYKDARCDMNILDETFGPENWSRKHKLINGNLFCSVGVYISQMDMWVWKQDVGTESQTEKEKGEASDSFKRACFNWGIGRELYTAPKMFINKSDLKTHEKMDNGRYTCKDYFAVRDIRYAGRRITYVRIRNEKTGKELEFGQLQGQAEIENQPIGMRKAAALLKLLNDSNVNIDKLMTQYGVAKLEDLTEKNHADIVTRLNRGK